MVRKPVMTLTPRPAFSEIRADGAVGVGSGGTPAAACAAHHDKSGFTFVSAERGNYSGLGWYCNGYGNGYSGVFTNLKVAAQCLVGTAYNDASGKCESVAGCTFGRLLGASYADGNSRRYSYGDSRFCSALTGVANNGSVTVSYVYDTAGRASSMQYAGVEQAIRPRIPRLPARTAASWPGTTWTLPSIGGRCR